MALIQDIRNNVNYYSSASFGNIIIDTLTGSSNSKWGGYIGTGATLTYSFPWTTNSTASWSTGYDSEPTAKTTSGLNSSQIKMALLAFGKISNIVDIKFTEIAETSTNYGDIRIGFSSAVSSWGHAFYPNTSSSKSGGDIWISSNYINEDFSLGTYNFSSLLHELGHALGLKHPFEDTPILPKAQDYNIYTLMSYTSYKSYIPIFSGEKTSTGSNVNMDYQSIEPDNYMVYDIAALQALYGANKTSNIGNNTYKYGTTAFYTTIWDAGGVDTIDLSSTTHSNIVKLTAGSYSTINYRSVDSQITEQQLKYKTELGTNWYDSWVKEVFLNYKDEIYTGENALGIAYGVIIENATGGNGTDSIIGNSVNNTLNGLSGNDTLSGLVGNDVLDGGAGVDIMLGGAGNDIYYVDNSSDKVYETTTATSGIDSTGIDKINSSISYALTSSLFVENLTLIGTSAINGTGNALNNVITGNSAVNTLSGLVGNDVLDGGAGVDIMLGGAGNDIYYVDNSSDKVYETTTATSGIDSTGIDKINSSISYALTSSLFVENLTLIGTSAINGTGNALNNVITGNSAVNTLSGLVGNDVLDGGAGVDIMLGGAGNDIYYVDNSSDKVYETTTATSGIDSTGIDKINSSISYALTSSLFVENLTLIGTSAINGTGNALNNVITGNSASNILTGGTGADKFVFNTAINSTTNVDKIKDFNLIDDTIVLENSIFLKLGMLTSLNKDYFKANLTGKAEDINDYLSYETDSGKLFYDADGSTPTISAVLIALIENKASLTYADFTVI